MGFSKPNIKNEENLPVRLVLCLDGTGDTAEGAFSAVGGVTVGTKDSIKSIFDMAKAGIVADSTGKRAFQFVQYFEGVGTVGVAADAGVLTRAGALFDGATGNGYLDILRYAYKVCCQKLQHGEKNEIFIFGFSRGAFISRALASFLQHVGLIKGEYLDQDDTKEEQFQARFQELLGRYCDLTKKSMFGTKISSTERSKDLLPFCMQSPRVRLVGAFDTVKTVIPLPVHNFLFHRIPNIDFEMDAPGIVDHFRHALALNEARPLFNPDLWKSDLHSDDSSYLEAWFFGFHHDIGGGDKAQGLALWPLQWILHAAMEYGLVLDPTVDPYDVLFSGTDNIIQTPHGIAMKMFDMIRHHVAKTSWGLRLNEPFSLMQPQPRNYFEYLTTPPYLKFIKPKVFLHPSAYLIFDVSSSFRIQVYEWKYLRNFLRDRSITLPQSMMPWWEEQMIDSVLKESAAVKHLNLFLYGRPGTGKAALIGRMFGEVIGLSGRDINTPLSIPGNSQVRIYCSDGFGAGGSDDRTNIEKFLARHRESADIEDQIHAMWYFLDCSDEEIQPSEKEFFDMNFGDIPVLVVLKNEDKLKDNIKESLVDQDFAGELKILSRFNQIIEGKKSEMVSLPVRKYVQARNPLDTPKNLLRETSINFKSQSIHIAQIKAQRIEVYPKVALATEESVRAYTIWHSFKFREKKVAFSRNSDPRGLKLSTMLMEPILATFNVRFPGDDVLIQSKIGGPWSALDKYKSGLWDVTLPGDLILICMLDTIIVMTHALSHQHISGKVKTVTDNAQPLCALDIDNACEWYTAPKENRQVETHDRVRSLLAQDWSPKDKSVANLQMKVIETVELQSKSAESATTVGLIGDAIKSLWGRKSLFG